MVVSHDRQRWFLCFVDGSNWFYRTDAASNDWERLTLHLIPYNHTHGNVLAAKITVKDIFEQCGEQGFEKSSINLIKAMVTDILWLGERTISFYRVSDHILLQENINEAISIDLKLMCREVQGQDCIEIMESLLKNILGSSCILQHHMGDTLRLLQSKDKAIEFLMDKLVEYGGKSALERWGPPGSINYRILQPHDQEKWLQNSLQSLGNTRAHLLDTKSILDAARTLLQLRLPVELETNTKYGSSSKQLGLDDEFVFAKGVISKDNVKEASERESTTFSPLPSPSASPRKKRKFGKVKASK